MNTTQIFVALISSIMTAAVTLLAVFFTNRGNTNRLLQQQDSEQKTKRAALHREKLEELYVLASKYTNLLGTSCLPYLRVMEGKLDYNQALDLTIEDGNKEVPDFDRLQMLIDIYFPELRESFKQLFNVREKLNDIMGVHKHEYKQGNLDGRKFVKPMLSALANIDIAGNKLKKEIIAQEKVIEKHVGAP